MRDWLQPYHKIVPEAYQEDFAAELSRIMLVRGRDIARLIILFEIVMIVSSFIWYGSDMLVWPRLSYLVLYVILILPMATFLLMRNHMFRIRRNFVVLKVTTTLSFFILGWSMTISILDLQNGGDVTVYVLAQVGIGVLSLYTPLSTLIAYVVIQLSFLLLTTILQGPEDLFGYYLNTTIVMLLSWMISRILFHQQLSLFANRRVIEEQNTKLSNTNEQLAKANKELSYLSTIDFLTGTYNRLKLDQVLTAEWERCKRYKLPLSAIMIDIDFYKSYNDNYGHLQGDECIRDVANVLKTSASRTSDLVVRYGGDEFVILLPHMGIEESTQVAEKIRSGVEALQMKTAYSPIADVVTVSLGVTTLIPQADNDVDSFLREVDKALYASKNGKRNSVTAIQL